MKKQILKSTLFLVFLAAFIWGLSFYFMPKNDTAEAGMREILAKGFLAEPENSLDYLVVGDSLPLTGVDPWAIWRDRGYTGYICAAGALDAEKGAGFLEMALENQQPKVVLVETHHLYVKITALESAVQRFQRLIPVLEYHDNWKFLKPEQALQPVCYDNPMLERGYYLRKAVSGAAPGDYMAPQEGEDPIPEQSIRIVKRMAQLCRQRNITMVLFSLPSSVNWNDAAHRAVAALAQELELPYLDMNLLDIGIDWSKDTLDGGDHLNATGAEKASACLETVLDGYGLRDKRDDPEFARWNRDLETFTALAAAATDRL